MEIKNVELRCAQHEHQWDALEIVVAVATETLEQLLVLLPPEAGVQLDVTLAPGDEDHPVGEVYHEVETYVGQQLLVDQFVHGAFPSQQDLVKTSKVAGVADLASVGDGHCPEFVSAL